MITPRMSLRSWATIVSVTLVVVVVRIEEGRIATAHQRTRKLALEASNVRAERDSTRLVGASNERMARLLHDSLRLVERLVVQQVQQQDELDRARRRERIARFSASVIGGSLSASSRGVVEANQLEAGRSVRRARFLVRQMPYTLIAEVGLPEAPDTGVMSVHIALDTMHLETRIGCAAPDGNGIRDATVSVTGPRWAAVRLDRVEQSPELCASPALQARQKHSRLGDIRLVVGAGPALDRYGRVNLSVFVGLGFGVNR